MLCFVLSFLALCSVCLTDIQDDTVHIKGGNSGIPNNPGLQWSANMSGLMIFDAINGIKTTAGKMDLQMHNYTLVVDRNQTATNETQIAKNVSDVNPAGEKDLRSINQTVHNTTVTDHEKNNDQHRLVTTLFICGTTATIIIWILAVYFYCKSYSYNPGSCMDPNVPPVWFMP